MKDSARSVMRFLEWEYPRFVTVPELIQALGQSDIRKRVSELVAEGVPIEKQRMGRFVNYRYAGGYQCQKNSA